jgi:putative two-component system response regulator
MRERAKILVVEDEPGPQEALTLILRPYFDLYLAESADAALQTLKDISKIDVITLDLVLPGRSGVELLQELKRDHDGIEVIVLTGYGTLLSASDCFQHGASAYLIKPFDQIDVLREVNLALVRKRILSGLNGFIADLQNITRHDFAPRAVRGYLAHNPKIMEHTEAVYRYALQLAERLPLSPTDRQHLEIGALLHDIGIIAISNYDLAHSQTNGTFSVDDIQQAHGQIGARIAMEAQLPSPIIEIIQYHHERYDGSGYPHHLVGEDIPYLARIVGIANSIAHVTTLRQAQGDRQNAIKRLALGEVKAFLKVNAGSRFDPWLVELWRPESLSTQS